MPQIVPVSDLRDYNKVLTHVSDGQPVYLTRNGRGRYAIVDLAEYERSQATMNLLSDLARGEQSALESGWLSADEVERALAP
jgi:prevent-host-death family protein